MNTHKEPIYKWRCKTHGATCKVPQGTACIPDTAPLEPKEKCLHKKVEVKVRGADEGSARVCESTCLSCGTIVGVDKVYLDDGELEAPEPPEIELHTPQSLEEEIDKWASEPTPPSQIEEEPGIGATLEVLATQRGVIIRKMTKTSELYSGYKEAKSTYQEEIKRIDNLMLALKDGEAINKLTKEDK